MKNMNVAMKAVDPVLRPSLYAPIRWFSRLIISPKQIRFFLMLVSVINAIATRYARLGRILGYLHPESLKIVIVDKRSANVSGEISPALLHIHGGGYAMGSPGQQMHTLERVSSGLNCLVVSVDYRLAPKTPFPGTLEYSYAALGWLHLNANTLGVDISRIAVMGESAGEGHAATLAIIARDRDEYQLCMRVLIYPMLDDGTRGNADESCSGHYLLNATFNRMAWGALLSTVPGGNAVPEGTAPSRVADLSLQPKTWTGVGSLDLFHAQSITYPKRLQSTGVETEPHIQSGAFHGFGLVARKTLPAELFTNAGMLAHQAESFLAPG